MQLLSCLRLLLTLVFPDGKVGAPLWEVGASPEWICPSLHRKQQAQREAEEHRWEEARRVSVLPPLHIRGQVGWGRALGGSRDGEEGLRELHLWG